MKEKAIDEIRAHVNMRVNGGFDDEASIVEGVMEMFADPYYLEHPDPAGILPIDQTELRPVAEQITRESFARHEAEAQTWTSPTDCDRLDAAFADLESQGIVARQNFSCCGNCGHGEIWDEIEQAREERAIIGYTFFHMQDTESAASGYGLCLSYGSTEEGEEAAVSIGHRIVEALTNAGLPTKWNGRLEQRISVEMNWQKRRNTQMRWSHGR